MFRILISLCLLWLIAASPVARAQTLTPEQREKLLTLLPPPRTWWSMNYGLYGNKLSVSTEVEDKSQRLARLLIQKAPARSREQAKRLMDLSDAYFDNSLLDKEMAAASEAETIYRDLLKQSPDDLQLQRGLADALVIQKKDKEAEGLYREGIRKAPESWEAWLALAGFVERQAGVMVFGKESGSFGQLVQFIVEHKLTPEQAADVRAKSDEAVKYYEKARELAPREPRIIEEMMVRYVVTTLVQAALDNAAGKPIDAETLAQKATFGPVLLARLQQLVDIQPDEPFALTTLTFLHTSAILAARTPSSTRSDRPTLTDAEQKPVREAILSLEKMGHTPGLGAVVRSRAWEAAGFLSILLGDSSAAVRRFHEARVIAPERLGGWEGEIATLGSLEHYEEAYTVAKAFLMQRDDVTTWLMVASLAMRTNRLDEAETLYRKVMEKSPERAPDNLLAFCGLATVLCKQSVRNPESFADAVKLVNGGRSRYGDDLGKNQANVYIVVGTLYALTDNVTKALQFLEEVQKAEPDNEQVTKIVELLKATR